jgi:chromatin remodeling complex protein RSC6
LNFFEKIEIEFPGGEYPPVEWVKAKSELGTAFDVIEIKRNYLKDKQYSSRLQQKIKVQIRFFVENHPKKYKLSPQLSKILGIEEETRLRIIGALWQYIKSNRL